MYFVLMKENGLKMLNNVLRRIFRSKRDATIGRQIRLHNEEFRILCFLPLTIPVPVATRSEAQVLVALTLSSWV
jgi:hypothetical protein